MNLDAIRHLHLLNEEHKNSAIGKHYKDYHTQQPTNLHEQFTILKKFRAKFKSLVNEMLLIRRDQLKTLRVHTNRTF